MTKKKDNPLTPVVQPEQDMRALQRAASAAKPANLAQPQTGNVGHNAWAAYRASHTQQVSRPKSLGEMVKAPPPPLSVVPLSRREARPCLSFVRPINHQRFELVSHTLVDGELLDAKIKVFATPQAAYEELVLMTMAQCERAVRALADFKRESGLLEDSDEG